MDNNYNPLEIHEGLIPRFISWFKKKFKTIVTIGSVSIALTAVGLGLTAIQVFRPDPAKEISKTINGIIQDAQTLEIVNIPDTLLSNEEVQLLKSYHSAYNNYINQCKAYQTVLNDRKFDKKNDASILQHYLHIGNHRQQYRFTLTAIINQCNDILQFEQNSGNQQFIYLLDIRAYMSLIERLKSENNEWKRINAMLQSSVSNHNSYYQHNKTNIFKSLNNMFFGNEELESFELQKRILKDFHIACNVRLMELINEHQGYLED